MWLLQIAIVAAVLQQPQVQTGVLEGTVTRMGVPPVPLAGVAIKAERMAPAPETWVAETITNGGGSFSIRDVPPGRYLIRASAEGYGTRASLFSPLGPQTVTVNVEPGRRVQVPPLALMAAATIRGRVLDKDDRPLPTIRVEILKLTRDEQGRRVWAIIPGEVNPSSLTRRPSPIFTDSNGEFRHPLLGPGDYYLRAILNESDSLPLSVYYPETTETRSASPVTVAEGASVVADIRIGNARETPSYRISGTIAHPALDSGNLIVGLRLVQRPSPDAIVSSPLPWVRGITDDKKGRFELLQIRPGSYDLIASVVIDGREQTATVPVEVRDQDIEGLTLPLRSSVDIKGRLVADQEVKDIQFARRPFATRDPARSRAGDVRITLKGGLLNEIELTPVIDESGTTFAFDNVPQGDYEIVPTIVPDELPPNPDLYISDIRAGGRSVFDNGLRAGVDATEALEVIVATGGGSIEGRVQGTSAVVAALILAPESFRRNNATLYRVTYLPRNGSFKLSGLAPGTYKIFAVPYLNETVPYRSAEFLARHEASALTVTVAKGAAIGGLRVPFLSLGR